MLSSARVNTEKALTLTQSMLKIKHAAVKQATAALLEGEKSKATKKHSAKQKELIDRLPMIEEEKKRLEAEIVNLQVDAKTMSKDIQGLLAGENKAKVLAETASLKTPGTTSTP